MEKQRLIDYWKSSGTIIDERLLKAFKSVPRELFIKDGFEEEAYGDYPLPIGSGQTISQPTTVMIMTQALELKEGQKVLEVGAGSGYGAALAQELVDSTGLVVSIEINAITYRFASANLNRMGYGNIVLVLGDGSLGHPKEAPYDAICITAACPEIPQPLVDQLKAPGRLMAPVGGNHSLFGQDLVLLEKGEDGLLRRSTLMKVAYVPLTGEYGWTRRERP